MYEKRATSSRRGEAEDKSRADADADAHTRAAPDSTGQWMGSVEFKGPTGGEPHLVSCLASSPFGLFQADYPRIPTEPIGVPLLRSLQRKYIQWLGLACAATPGSEPSGRWSGLRMGTLGDSRGATVSSEPGLEAVFSRFLTGAYKLQQTTALQGLRLSSMTSLCDRTGLTMVLKKINVIIQGLAAPPTALFSQGSENSVGTGIDDGITSELACPNCAGGLSRAIR
ncbi:hypothetical protein NM208_g12382 [Fusarium decemcellulare]|uniref:Uncharacterized protein n=1 Tax=Fusarium decemcellulare TaxID=57161 RepID=A0ACC1RQM7_9HYPO|nr:hypothetical protein NM208_g12382 [Fusarium decemcellulare]